MTSISDKYVEIGFLIQLFTNTDEDPEILAIDILDLANEIANEIKKEANTEDEKWSSETIKK